MNDSTKDYLSVPRIPKDSVRLVYHNNYWDGPISGVVKFDGKRYYFDQCDEEENGKRRYVMYELSDEQWKEEDYWHDLFRTHVGTHTEYDENGKRGIGATKEREEWEKYYSKEASRVPLNLEQNEIVGWFTRT